MVLAIREASVVAPVDAPRGGGKGFLAGLALVLLVHLGVTGWLLISSDFLPYVTDNNESFSSLVHAKNLYQFGFGTAFGLTDESYGPDRAAHPFIHTHQGNFPRLFA